MSQVIEYPPVGTGFEARTALIELARVCRETRDGESFKELRARLRVAKLWEPNRPRATLRFLGAGGRVIKRSPFMQQLADAPAEESALEVITDRLFELNPLLAKAVVDLISQRAHGKDEIYKHLGSFAYKGSVPSRPDLESWVQIHLTAGTFRQVGIAMAPGPHYDRLAQRALQIDVEEFLADDKPEPEPEIPGLEDDAAPTATATGVDTAAILSAGFAGGAAITPSAPNALPPALRHLAAANLSNPRNRDRPVPPARFATAPSAPFPDDILEETTRRISAWWADVKVPSQGHKPEDFGLDAEGWVEGADEVLYRIAVAGALAFRLDADREGVVRAFKALDAAGVLTDLYHGTVPADLPGGVDARALMLASLAARRCAEAPELAASLDQKKTAAEAFVALDGALGRGLFRIELLWILRMLGQLGVVRYDDLADYTAVPYRVVRDVLFRNGYADSPYASDAATLASAARGARRAAGTSEPADEVLAAFALAAGCAYDCPHRKTCDFPCRERLE